ncbi:MAG: 3-hydroxyacyl-ACP dehydratase FabZ [Gammaproteobacteria bacterium]|nr:3-hydroxyacyl-ACP dehydratase FabZ [Gammaproteobacteria bacterium]
MDIEEILRHVPHRYPFVLIDRVLKCEPHKSIVAIKNVTYNEPFFPGHFPDHPVMPGVLILEALAQAAGILGLRSMDKPPGEGTNVYFAGIDNARFKQPVVPGDQLIVEVNYQRDRRGIWKFSGEAKVDGKVAAGADIMVALSGNKG